jgi:AcrR family transcriptional regulator
MSGAEGARAGLLVAATALGVAEGVSALTVQGIATAAGVSKALVLYHFGAKAPLLEALAERIAAASCTAMRAAAAQPDPLAAWRKLAEGSADRGERALLAALMREPPVRARAVSLTAEREGAATELAVAVLQALELRPRIAPGLLGRLLLRQLDGLAVSAHEGRGVDATQAELDGFALALLALGR